MTTTRRPRNHLIALAGALLLVCLMLPGNARAAGNDDAEVQARTHFAAGRYSQALDIYARLYAETLHPTYLRNIARCHQRLRDPDQAITSFREYLHKAKDLTPEQRAEVEGYIAEMEQLKKTRAASATPAAPAAPPPDTPAASPSGAPPPAPSATAPPSETPLLGPPTVTAVRADDKDGGAFYTRWWFWTIVGGVAAGGIAAALLLSGDDPSYGNLGFLDVSDKLP